MTKIHDLAAEMREKASENLAIRIYRDCDILRILDRLKRCEEALNVLADPSRTVLWKELYDHDELTSMIAYMSEYARHALEDK